MNTLAVNASNVSRTVDEYRRILTDLEPEINPDSKILDFGCGEGREVYQFRKMGYKAYGCDITNRYDNIQHLCREEKIINPGEIIFDKIDMANYRIPFAGETFDFVFSNQVFEHVKNYPEALSEIYRVLKPGGCSFHLLPSRYRLIEPHIFVPLGGIFQGHRYLSFWAFLGIRNSFQKGLNFKEVAHKNFVYLNANTNYLTKTQISNHVVSRFSNISFIEALHIKHCGGHLRYLYWLTKKLPFIASFIRTFHTKAIFFRKLTEKSPDKQFMSEQRTAEITVHEES